MRALGWWRPRGAQAIHTVCWSLKQLVLPGAGEGGTVQQGARLPAPISQVGGLCPPLQPGWPAPGLWVCTPIGILNGAI